MQSIFIKGNQFGIELLPRNIEKKDMAVVFRLLTEDDENWFPQSDGTSHIAWIPDLISVLNEANEYVKQNCKWVKGQYEFKRVPNDVPDWERHIMRDDECEFECRCSLTGTYSELIKVRVDDKYKCPRCGSDDF